jgi:hypothetical protein
MHRLLTTFTVFFIEYVNTWRCALVSLSRFEEACCHLQLSEQRLEDAVDPKS